MEHHWTGLRALRDWLEAYGVDMILDMGPCSRRLDLQTGGEGFFETVEDSASLYFGEAVRFHPSMFVPWRPDQGVPFGNERKVHLSVLGEWKVWQPPGYWIDVPIMPIEFFDDESFFAAPIGVDPTMQAIGLSYSDSDRVLQAIKIKGDRDRFPTYLPSGPDMHARALAQQMFPAFGA